MLPSACSFIVDGLTFSCRCSIYIYIYIHTILKERSLTFLSRYSPHVMSRQRDSPVARAGMEKRLARQNRCVTSSIRLDSIRLDSTRLGSDRIGSDRLDSWLSACNVSTVQQRASVLRGDLSQTWCLLHSCAAATALRTLTFRSHCAYSACGFRNSDETANEGTIYFQIY
jgi:hypothetical protein